MMFVALHCIIWYGFLIGAALIVVATLNRLIRWIISPLRKLPGPQGRHLPLGNFPEILREPHYDPPKRWWREAGVDAPMLHYTVVLWKQALLILDKEIVKTILTSPYAKEPMRFTKPVETLRATVGDGLATVQGVDWARHRRILQPAFNTRFLKESMNGAVPFRVKQFIECWKPAADEDWEIEVSSHFSALTLDIVGDVAFSHSFNALDTLEAWSKQMVENGGNKQVELADVGDSMLSYFRKIIRFNLVTALCLMLNIERINWYINPQLRLSRMFLDVEVEKIVAEARIDTTKSRSLLHILLHARDPEVEQTEGDTGKLSDNALRSEVKTFMIAGHETSSTWLHWTLFALVKYPDVQERLYKEIVTYASLDQDKYITLEQTDQMEYLSAFLQGVLRMYPPVGGFIRHNTFEEKWHGVTIPPDTRLIVTPHLMHRHPKYWDNPESFMPERWINVSQEEAERRRFAFIPFSAGGRNCEFERDCLRGTPCLSSSCF